MDEDRAKVPTLLDSLHRPQVGPRRDGGDLHAAHRRRRRVADAPDPCWGSTADDVIAYGELRAPHAVVAGLEPRNPPIYGDGGWFLLQLDIYIYHVPNKNAVLIILKNRDTRHPGEWASAPKERLPQHYMYRHA